MQKNKTYKIVNQKQAYKYIKNGVKPVDIVCGFEDKLVFVFEESDKLQELFNKWKKYEL